MQESEWIKTETKARKIRVYHISCHIQHDIDRFRKFNDDNNGRWQIMKFYFTFRLVNQPFTGGWVVINADSRAQACMLFRAAFQPNDEMLNCCSIYEEREFKRTKMYRENDNFGSSCHCELGLKIEKK